MSCADIGRASQKRVRRRRRWSCAAFLMLGWRVSNSVSTGNNNPGVRASCDDYFLLKKFCDNARPPPVRRGAPAPVGVALEASLLGFPQLVDRDSLYARARGMVAQG